MPTPPSELRAARRLAVLRGLSGSDHPVCACCGERRLWALTIDHIHGGGVKDRKARGHTSTWVHVAADYRASGVWPTDRYQVLCATCNHGRRVGGGVCPHLAEQVEV